MGVEGFFCWGFCFFCEGVGGGEEFREVDGTYSRSGVNCIVFGE